MAEIAIRNVEKTYGTTKVVHGVDLTIPDGEFAVILGPSGCGKSTLLRMIAGLEAITAGEIAIGGTVVNQLEPRERGCAMVFQNYALYPHFSVAENIGYALKVAGVPKAARMERVAKVARSVGLQDFLDRKPGQLSGGQRQRVAMARAMIREPKVFLFDEPLSNLDAKLRVQMRIELRRLHNRLSATSVFVTHDQVEAMTLADKVVVMNAGRIEQIGTPTEIYERPATLFVAGFIGSPPMNLVEAEVTSPGTLRITGADGSAKALPEVAVPTGYKLVPSQRVTLGFRAEEIQLKPDGAYPFQIEFVEKLGPVQLVHGAFAGMDIVVQTPAGVTFVESGTLRFDLPKDALHIFNHADGQRIGSGAPARSMPATAKLAMV